MRFDSSLESLNLAGLGVTRSESVTDLNVETRGRKSMPLPRVDSDIMQTPSKPFGIGELSALLHIFGMV